MTFKPYFCPTHEVMIEEEGPCPQCMEMWPNLPDPQDMTPDERVEEFDRLGMVLTVTFDMLHERLEALVGRSIWTHEFGLSWDRLREECRLEEREREPDMEKVIQPLIDLGKPVFLVGVSEGDES